MFGNWALFPPLTTGGGAFSLFFFPLDIRKAGWREETQEGNPSCSATKGIVCVKVSGELVSELNTPLSFLTLVYTLSSLHKPST